MGQRVRLPLQALCPAPLAPASALRLMQPVEGRGGEGCRGRSECMQRQPLLPVPMLRFVLLDSSFADAVVFVDTRNSCCPIPRNACPGRVGEKEISGKAAPTTTSGLC